MSDVRIALVISINHDWDYHYYTWLMTLHVVNLITTIKQRKQRGTHSYLFQSIIIWLLSIINELIKHNSLKLTETLQKFPQGYSNPFQLFLHKNWVNSFVSNNNLLPKPIFYLESSNSQFMATRYLLLENKTQKKIFFSFHSSSLIYSGITLNLIILRKKI